MKNIYCPKCAWFVAARESMLGGSAICPVCAGRYPLKEQQIVHCPDCGADYYLPGNMTGKPALPCAAQHKQVHHEQALAAAQEAAAARRAAEAGDIIAWPRGENALVFVPELGNGIRANSILIVGQNEKALYMGGGQQKLLPGGTYALFADARTPEEMIMAIYAGEADSDALTLRLDTHIVFFNMRWVEVRADWVFRPGTGEAALHLPLRVQLRMQSPETLMQNNLPVDITDGAHVSEYLEQEAIDAVLDAMQRCVAPQAEVAMRETEGRSTEVLMRVCDMARDAQVLKMVNDRLRSTYGLQVKSVEARSYEAALMR